ncbi:PP2C family protein-serine/threonine phosphatase [Embleya hyalina]|uniref:PP2C family protein-serine/threonine phosphatase n=1 Tax=Embleya hyalina TaxID=516124 RepID=UPI001FE791D5|nr:PP2C family protein-serine/threonine phosphatase [Embleya hyalina]
MPTESLDTTSVFSAPTAHDSRRRRANVPEDVVTKGNSRFGDLTVLLISEDEEEAFRISLLLPIPFVRSMVWHRNPGEAGPFLAVCRGPMCVLVGRSAPGARPTETVRRLRRAAPHAALVVLAADTASTAVIAPGEGAAHAYVDGRCVDPEKLCGVMRRALRRRHKETATATTEANALIVRDSLTLERGLLPVPALRGNDFSAAVRYEPGRAHALLSGDFYDVVQLEDSSVHVILGDVSGHGAAEAALAVQLRVAWRTALLCGKTQLEQLGLLEKILIGERPDGDTYATVISLVFPPGGASMRAVSAGHSGLLLRRAGELRWVEPRTGTALGLFPGQADWTETELELLPLDRVVVFTDGLSEGRTEPSARLGEDGLLRLATRYSHLPSQEFVDALVGGVASMAAPFGGLADDVAVLHLGWNPPTSPLPR